MGSIKETNESGCRNMPGTGIHMIVVEFISSINREIIFKFCHILYQESRVECFIKLQCFIFAYIEKLQLL